METSQRFNSSKNEPTDSMIAAAKNDYAYRLYMHTQQQLIRAKSKQQSNHQKSRKKEKNSVNILAKVVCCSSKPKKTDVENIDSNNGGSLSSLDLSN
ncbi:3214_t:CDS:2 [Cetraspora pellucida]|uniref:3214_t:CDS:1 n=1 Tax=Cetraspora pellucida TaxID=1433469 RepID=A0A9N9GXH4_9GLOM|nr:3214_t:CDS:2 [Cetraspora pellucida]